MRNVYVALENLRSLYNIGAIFRTCSFFGIKNIVLVGYSGKTYDLKGKEILHSDILKTSLGAENDLNIIFLKDTDELIDFAKKEQLKLVAVEQTPESRLLTDWTPEENVVLVFGNEVDGVSARLLSVAEECLEINRYGMHNSLNVSTVVGIVLFHMAKSC